MSALSVRNMVMGFFRRRSFPIDPSDKADALLVHFAAKGFVLVPVEPTEAMVVAAPGRPDRATEESIYHGIYRAMLAAAAKETTR